MRRFAAAAFAIILAALAPPAAPAAAQGAGVSATAAPRPNSAQRRSILDALRPAIERRLGPDVEFVVQDIRVAGGWAFVMAEPRRRGGRPILGRRYFPNFDDMDGLTVTALLRFQGRWTLVDHAIGATDVWYCGRAPRSLVGC
jgi:hypothetical protein